MLDLYLNFSGNCKEAIDTYSKVFKTKASKVQKYSDLPGHNITGADGELIMYAQMEINGSRVMLADTSPNRSYICGNNVTIAYSSQSSDEINEIFAALKDGGEAILEIKETFFSKCFGIVKDKFGIIWQLTLEIR